LENRVGKNCAISSDLHIFPVKFILADFLSLRKIIILYKLLFSHPIIQENTTGGKDKQFKWLKQPPFEKEPYCFDKAILLLS